MRLPFFIARRYLFSTKKKTSINIISLLAVIEVGIITAALVAILSVFNGLEDLLYTLNNSFDPEIRVIPAKGKSFEVTPSQIKRLNSIEGVDIVTEVIEDYAYIKYRDANQVVIVKGVSNNFIDQHRIDNSIVNGELKFQEGNVNYALIGAGVRFALSIDISNQLEALQVFYIKNLRGGSLDPSKLYSQRAIYPSAEFSIMQNFDDNYIIAPISFMESLLNYSGRRTSLEIKSKKDYDVQVVKQRLQDELGKDFLVQDHKEQHADLYRLIKMEKLFFFIAFSLLLSIGSINIFFSLSILALDKKKDISIVAAMGAPLSMIRSIFILEGCLIALIGSFSGLALGGTLCWLQERYSIISMGMQSAVVDGYPVKMVPLDFVYVLITMILITFFISYRPALMASRMASASHL